ncbi:DNA ligase 6 isoform X5 [Syzygium oleosum]|nr:DNA ligase 6 isoform X5 [Syzygium oleosum]
MASSSETAPSYDSTRLFLAATDKTSATLPPPPPDLPPSKLIPHTRFLVDAFRFAGDHSVSYFLSHFHSDHYTGLSPAWSRGVVFCSPTTSRLLIEVLGVPAALVVSLPVGEAVSIDGCEVRLVDANHCPGAVMFLFKVPGGGDGEFRRYVHTGDFRFRDSMRLEPGLGEFVACDAIFLDTTYCNPKFVFPCQEESIDYIVSVIERVGGENRDSAKSILFIVATYVIGKERILLEVARRCGCKVYVDGRKMAILHALGYGESGAFTEDESETAVHVVGWNVLGETWPYFRPNFVQMKEIMVEKGYNKVVGFVPTGWTYEVKRDKFAIRKKDSFEIHLVPYSEHSNYNELREFVKFLKPKRVVPTVGSDIEKLDSKHFHRVQKHFAGLLDETANKKEFLMNFLPRSSEKEDIVGEVVATASSDALMREKEENLSKEDLSETLDPKSVLGETTDLKKGGFEELDLPSEEGEKEILQALQDCLPAWVTRDQMIGLINSTGRNLVDAVSNFYEKETEFYQQVSAYASASSLRASVMGSGDVHSSPSAPDSEKGSACGTRSTFSKDYKLSTVQLTMTSKSPGKKKRNVSSSPKKKQKSAPKKLESSGSGQSRITRFFTKSVPNSSSQDGGVEPNFQPCFKDDKFSSSYYDKIDQFIQIVNGDDSLRSYAASILEKTKGDIDKALDVYYRDTESRPVDNNDISVVTVAPSQSVTTSDGKFTTGQITLSEKSGSVAAISVERPLAEICTDFVSVPLEKYNPIEHASWRRGEPAPYIHLARTFDLVEREKGKIKVTSMLCNMLRSLLALSPEDVLPAMYLCTNKIAPDHENMELNIGGSLVTAAIEDVCGAKRSKIRDMYNRLGDLGDVAQECRQTQTFLAPPPVLLIKDVFSVLKKISLATWWILSLLSQVKFNSFQTGSGSNVRKKSLIVSLMRSCREMEMKFIVRTLVRNLRIGAMMRTVLPAFAQAVVMNSSLEDTSQKLEKIQSLSAYILEAYNVLPSLDLIIPSLMKEGIEFSSSHLSMIPGLPIKPMLAKITNGCPSVLKLFESRAFTCEYKYDGQRAQIHKLADGSIRIFSRNGDETTSRFPDVIAIIKESCKPSAVTFILDAEVVAVDRKCGCKLMSFQELSSRERGGRDSLVSLDSIKVDICIFVFDVMFANGEQLLGFPLRERRKVLRELFNDEKKGFFEYVKEMTVDAEDSHLDREDTLTRMNLLLEDALRSSCEGIMVKSLDIDAGYSPSKRAETWLKVKRDYVEGLGDSLDLVPIGAWHGNGRKAG